MTSLHDLIDYRPTTAAFAVVIDSINVDVCIGVGRECVSTDAAGAQTRRSLGHHLLHPLILRLLVLCAPADFEAQIQFPNACPGGWVH